jgi:hypothetical protein
MQATTTSQQIAETILAQLGGNRFALMTGSKNFMAMSDGLRMDLSKNATSANRCRIILTPADTYDVVFYKQTLNKKTLDVTVKEIAQYEGIYFDQLQPIFTSVTGLDTKL